MNRTWSNSFRPVSGRRRLNGRRGLKQRSAPVEKKAGKHPNADTDRQAGKRSLGNTIPEGIDSMGSFRLNAVGPFANAVLHRLCGASDLFLNSLGRSDAVLAQITLGSGIVCHGIISNALSVRSIN